MTLTQPGPNRSLDDADISLFRGITMVTASPAKFGRVRERTKVYPAWNKGAFVVGALIGAPT